MSYTTLKADIAGWMNRTDLTAQIPGFITIAESRFQLDVRSWQMLTPAVLTVPANAPSVPAPVDWLEWNKLSINGVALEYVNNDVMQQAAKSGNSANLGAYTMVGGNLIVGGPSANDVAVQTSYYARIPSIVTTSAESNWLLDTYPALYLYASLTSACAYVGDDKGAGQYAGAYEALCRDINSNATKATVSGSQWRQRAR